MSSVGECPYCLEPIAEDESAIITCGACGTAHHADCWAENGGCCVRSCRDVSRVIEVEMPSEAREKLVISREAIESTSPRRAVAVSNPCIRCGRQVPEGELHCQECAPQPDENPDTANAGPLMVMIAIVGLVLALAIVLVMSPGPDNLEDTPRPQVPAGTGR